MLIKGLKKFIFVYTMNFKSFEYQLHCKVWKNLLILLYSWGLFSFQAKNFEEVINVEEKQGTVVIRGERERGNFCLEFQARVVLAPGNIASFVRHCPPALSGHLARLSLMTSLHSLLPLSHWPLDFFVKHTTHLVCSNQPHKVLLKP